MMLILHFLRWVAHLTKPVLSIKANPALNVNMEAMKATSEAGNQNSVRHTHANIETLSILRMQSFIWSQSDYCRFKAVLPNILLLGTLNNCCRYLPYCFKFHNNTRRCEAVETLTPTWTNITKRQHRVHWKRTPPALQVWPDVYCQCCVCIARSEFARGSDWALPKQSHLQWTSESPVRTWRSFYAKTLLPKRISASHPTPQQHSWEVQNKDVK